MNVATPTDIVCYAHNIYIVMLNAPARTMRIMTNGRSNIAKPVCSNRGSDWTFANNDATMCAFAKYLFTKKSCYIWKRNDTGMNSPDINNL